MTAGNGNGLWPTAETLPRKFYILDMFPYPSGAGLHVGHPEGLYGDGYSGAIQARARIALCCIRWDGMRWLAGGAICDQEPVSIRAKPRRKISAPSNGRLGRWVSAMIGAVRSTLPIRVISSGNQWIFLKIYIRGFNPKTNKAEPIETVALPRRLRSEEEKRVYGIQNAWRMSRKCRFGV